CALPERCLRKVLLPKQLPAGNGSPVGAEQLGQFADATRRRSLPHGAYQHDHRKEIDLAAEETHRRRCHAFTATVARAAETETVVVVFGKILGTARLAGIIGAMQAAPTRAGLLPRTLGKILVDGKKKQPKRGTAGQFMVHEGVLHGPGKPFGVHPSGTS